MVAAVVGATVAEAGGTAEAVVGEIMAAAVGATAAVAVGEIMAVVGGMAAAEVGPTDGNSSAREPFPLYIVYVAGQ